MWIISRAANPGHRLGLLSACGGLAIAGAALSPVRLGVVNGDSMRPTLQPGQPFLFQSIDAVREPIRHGDVLVFRSGGGYCIKRVLALGGEHFWALGRRGECLRACRILTVNTPVAPWIARFPRLHSRKVSVPAGQLFVVGDGGTSLDSRQYGPIPASRVVGRVMRPGEDRDAALAGVAWTRLPPTPKELPAWMARYGSMRPSSSPKSTPAIGGVLADERAAGRRDPRVRPWSYGASSSSARSRRRPA